MFFKTKWKLPKGWVAKLLVVVFAAIGIAVVYFWNAKQIALASDLRRDGQLQRADAILGRCMNLPGQRDAVQGRLQRSP